MIWVALLYGLFFLVLGLYRKQIDARLEPAPAWQRNIFNAVVGLLFLSYIGVHFMATNNSLHRPNETPGVFDFYIAAIAFFAPAVWFVAESRADAYKKGLAEGRRQALDEHRHR